MTSPRKYPRTARLNESLLEVLAEALERLSDPRLELVTLTGVDVSRDLSHAKVYYSTLAKETAAQRPEGSGARSRRGDAEAADRSGDVGQAAAAGLRAAAAHLRGVVGRELRIRQVPMLVFQPDAGIAAGQRIEEILRGNVPLLPDDEDEA
jgi:ribosome-binding factor A